jgi:hypothetical protein
MMWSPRFPKRKDGTNMSGRFKILRRCHVGKKKQKRESERKNWIKPFRNI